MTQIQWFAFVILPCALAALALVASRLFDRAHPVPGEAATSDVIANVNTIKLLLKRAGLPRESEALFWRAVLEKYVNSIKPDLGGRADLQKISDEAANELKAPDGALGNAPTP